MQQLLNLIFFVVTAIGVALSFAFQFSFGLYIGIALFIMAAAAGTLLNRPELLERDSNSWYFKESIQVLCFMISGLFLLMIFDRVVTPSGISYGAYLLFTLVTLGAYRKPLGNYLGFPSWLESGVYTVGWIMFMFHITIVVLLPVLQTDDADREPCGSKSPQTICYSIPPSTCHTVWMANESLCREELRPILETKGPASLVGGMIMKCQIKKFDKQMYWNRTNTDDSFCTDYFNTIK